MVLVGIDVAKDKHDCYIINTDEDILYEVFTIPNDLDGFKTLYQAISQVTSDILKVKVGLESTGHYSKNLLSYLINKNLITYVINPLHTSLYRKGQSLRKTKTDKIDSKTIAFMLMTDSNLKPYLASSYHTEELKSFTRYRFTKVKERAKLKASVTRLINILFPELENIVSSIHNASIYSMLKVFPGASLVAESNLVRLKNILLISSKGRYKKETAIMIRDAARSSIGSTTIAKSMELCHTIQLIQTLTEEIDEIESEIDKIMKEIDSPITSIPGINTRMAAMILAEIGDFKKFDSPDKILAFAGMSPSTYQSGKMNGGYSHMEKRGSRYLRYALFNATKYVCQWDMDFATYLAKKRDEGKHYNVAISHATKRLVRLIYAMEKSQMSYQPVA